MKVKSDLGYICTMSFFLSREETFHENDESVRFFFLRNKLSSNLKNIFRKKRVF